MLVLNWLHWLEDTELNHKYHHRDSLDYSAYPPVYTIRLTRQPDSVPEQFEIPINHSEHPLDKTGDLTLFPQSANITLVPGAAYELNIIPVYHPGLYDACENHSLNQTLTIPDSLGVYQETPSSITLDIPEGYSGYSILLFNGSDSASMGSGQSQATLTGDQSGVKSIGGLATGMKYTLVCQL